MPPCRLAAFLTGLLTRQIRDHKHPPCGCTAQHGGSGRYLFLGPDGGHYRRSNYARRVFRPACDGHHEASSGQPGRLVIADATTWPGVPIAAWPPADPSADYAPPRGRGIQALPVEKPLACWLPIRPGLTVHGLRHSHKPRTVLSRLVKLVIFDELELAVVYIRSVAERGQSVHTR